MKKNTISKLIVAFLLTTILVVYNNCGAQKAIQSSLDGYFAVLNSPVSDPTGDPNTLSGIYYRAFYSGNGDVNYIEMTFSGSNTFNLKNVVFPGADFNAGTIDEKIGTVAINNQQYIATYTQEHCDPLGTELFTINFTDATDTIQVSQNSITHVFYNKSKYNLSQTILSQLGPLSPTACQ
ncbi:MAG: hypothetical protein ACOYL6_01970 [Bacteriovoracaceae bacterium]